MADDNEGFLIHINGKSYDVADLTLNEAADVEDLCGGLSMDQLQFGSAKTLRALAFVVLKRDDPKVTLEQVGAAIKFRAILGIEPENTNGASDVTSFGEPVKVAN